MILVVLREGSIIDTVVYGMSLPLSYMPTWIAAECMLVIQTLLNFLVPSGSGQAVISMPIMAPLADLLGISRQVAVLCFQFGDGLSNIIWPTAFAPVLAALAGGILGGLSNYNKLTLSGAAYHSIYTYYNEKEQPISLVLSYSTSVSFMFDQWWKNDGVWGWYNPREGATRYEMLYMDGMNIGRGFDVIYNKSFMWHNQIDLTYPVVYQMLAVEAFASATGVTRTISDLSDFGNIDWYFAAGAGIKMQIPGFPLGLYLVENWTYKRNSGFQWVQSGIGNTGLKLVLAITTSYY